MSIFPSVIWKQQNASKNQETQLIAAMSKAILHPNYSLTENIIYVIDGGSLIQRLIWEKGDSYKAIYVKNVDYIKKTLGPNSIAIMTDVYHAHGKKYAT